MKWGQAVNRAVLSGTQAPVLSGTADPYYQEPKQVLTVEALSQICAPNFSNQESFGFLLTARLSSDVEHNNRQRRCLSCHANNVVMP